jgi:hypothetical protein
MHEPLLSSLSGLFVSSIGYFILRPDFCSWGEGE